MSNSLSRLMLLCGVLSCALAWPAPNELTDEEKADGFQLLFNGHDMTGWKGGPGWKVVDGALTRTAKGGMLWADGKYGDFILKVEYKFDGPCNSGIFIRTGNKSNPVQTGIEIQVLNDAGKKPDKHTNGAVYDAQAPSKNVTKVGDWNKAVITCKGSRIQVEMNGESIIDIDLDQWTEAGKNPDGTKNKYKTALKDYPRVGFIGFQDHGKPISYRSVKIKRLD